MDEPIGWPREWLRGVLDVAVLAVLNKGPTYGYAIATELFDAGLGVIKGGTLYPLLGRLEDAGYVKVEWRPGQAGPGRKFYALTEAGQAHARRQARAWTEFTTTTSRVTEALTMAASKGN